MAPAGILCDVRDVAQCHIRALRLPAAAGQRFGIATRELRESGVRNGADRAGTFNIQKLLDHVAAANDTEIQSTFPKLVKGSPGAEVPVQNWFDCSASLKTLDITPTSDEKTA